MQAGVSTASLFGRKTNEEALPLLNELGIRRAEVFLTTYSEYNAAFGKLLSSVKGDVDAYSVHVLNTQFEPQLFSVVDRVKEDAFSFLKAAMSAAKEFGAKYYTFHGIGRYKKAAREGKTDDYPFWAKRIEEIDEVCSSYGVKLSLETVEWSICRSPEIFKEIAKGYSNLSGVLDVKQTRISGYSDEAYIEAMAGRISHVHLSDVDADGKMRLPGKGTYDFPTLLKRLADSGFDGPLFIEAYKGDYERVEELKESCDFLEEIIYRYSL